MALMKKNLNWLSGIRADVDAGRNVILAVSNDNVPPVGDCSKHLSIIKAHSSELFGLAGKTYDSPGIRTMDPLSLSQ